MQRKGDNPTSILRFSAMKKLIWLIYYFTILTIEITVMLHSQNSTMSYSVFVFSSKSYWQFSSFLLKHEEQIKLIKWKFQSLKTDFLYFFFKWENLISLMDLKIKLKFFRLFHVSELMYILSRKIITKV